MELQKNLKSQPDENLTKLFEQAHRDPELKRELLRNPQAVAEKFGVKFNEDEVAQLQKLGSLSELAEDIKYGRLYPRPPIFYPIHVWQINELLDIFSHLIPGGGVTYPGPEPLIPSTYGQTAMFAMNAYRPGWVTYPGDDGQGGGSGGKGWAIPGPIFYPAGLRNILKERLVQILQVKQGLSR